MPALHGWRDCNPDALTTPNASQRIREAVIVVWSQLSESERISYHQHICLQRGGNALARNCVNIRRQIMAEAGLYPIQELIKEFDLPLYCNDDPTVVAELHAFGIPVVPATIQQQRETAEENIHVVIRVRDVLGDDPYPTLATRRRKIVCQDCKELCWSDPLSTPIAAHTLCIACARRAFIAARREEGTIV